MSTSDERGCESYYQVKLNVFRCVTLGLTITFRKTHANQEKHIIPGREMY